MLTFGILSKNLCARVSSSGFELGVLLSKNTIFFTGALFIFGFFLMLSLRICTAQMKKNRMQTEVNAFLKDMRLEHPWQLRWFRGPSCVRREKVRLRF